MHWGGGVNQSHLLPVLCQSSGSDRNAWVWQRGLPCQSLRTSPWMVPHLRYRLHQLQRFCLACREWWGSVSHEQAKSESMCKPFFFLKKKKAPCLWSFCKQEKLLSVLSLSQPFQMFTWWPFLRRQVKPYCLLAVPVTLLKGYRISSFWATDFYFFFCKGQKEWLLKSHSSLEHSILRKNVLQKVSFPLTQYLVLRILLQD